MNLTSKQRGNEKMKLINAVNRLDKKGFELKRFESRKMIHAMKKGCATIEIFHDGEKVQSISVDHTPVTSLSGAIKISEI